MDKNNTDNKIVITKYQIRFSGRVHVITMIKNAKILSAQVHALGSDTYVFIWAKHLPNEIENEERSFALIESGKLINNYYHYIQTLCLVVGYGTKVLHLFEIKPDEIY